MCAKPTGRVLALDLGAKRIGAAVCDESRSVVRPLGAIQRKNRDQVVAEVGRLAAEEQAVLLVVGLPRRLSGRAGEEAERAANLGTRLGRRLGLPVEFVDEAMTSVEAEQDMLEARLSRAKRREKVDSLAAALILERWLATGGEDPA